MASEKQISIEDNGQILARASVVPPGPDGEASAQVSVAAGHLPVGIRHRVAEAIHASVNEDEAERLVELCRTEVGVTSCGHR